MKISCLQMDMRLGDEAYNYAHAVELVREAVRRDGADTVVLPETWNTGYFPEDLSAHADRNGERTKAVFSPLAKELNIDLNRLLDSYTSFLDYPCGEFLKKVRRDLSLSQAEIAKDIGVSLYRNGI